MKTQFERELEEGLEAAILAMPTTEPVVSGQEWERLVAAWSARVAAMQAEDRYRLDRAADAEKEIMDAMLRRLARGAINAIRDIQTDVTKREKLWGALSWCMGKLDSGLEPAEASDLLSLVS